MGRGEYGEMGRSDSGQGVVTFSSQAEWAWDGLCLVTSVATCEASHPGECLPSGQDFACGTLHSEALPVIMLPSTAAEM